MTAAVHRLEVSRGALADALLLLKGIIRKRKLPDAVLTFDGSEISISLAGLDLRAPAKGTWPGSVVAPGFFFVAIAKAPLKSDPVLFEVRDGALRIGTFSVACSVQASPAVDLDLPLDPTLIEILEAASRHSHDELKRSGFLKAADEASDRAQRLIEKAAKVLEPLEIDRHDLQWLLERRLKRGHP
jgi:hypothetical protein